MSKTGDRDSTDRTVHVIKRARDDEQIRATVSDYRGRRWISLRIFWQPEGEDFVPTKRGITVSVDDLAELEAAVAAIRRAVDSEPPPARRPDRRTRYNRAREGGSPDR